MKNKEKILEIISKKHCWILASDLVKVLEEDMNKSTVYRNLDKLTMSSEILEELNEKWEKVIKKIDWHHHHFICQKCKIKINIGCFLNEKIKEISDKKWFTAISHSLSILWLCEDCKNKV